MAVRWHPFPFLLVGPMMFIAGFGLSERAALAMQAANPSNPVGLQSRCGQTGAEGWSPESEIVRFDVKVKSVLGQWTAVGALKVENACVDYYSKTGGFVRYSLCNTFPSSLPKSGLVLEMNNGEGEVKERFLPIQKGLTIDNLFQGIVAACRSQEPKMTARLERRAQEAEARQKAESARWEAELARGSAEAAEAARRGAEEEARRVAEFRAGILTALHAAEEPDPFSSIRRDFDLSSPDSHQWRTSLQLPGSERCRLIKTPPPAPTSASAWTFACVYNSRVVYNTPGIGKVDYRYENMVEAVQSVLDLPYQPDEKAENVNRVFFVDPSKPAWRFFVTKVSEENVGISVVAVRFAGAATSGINATPFPFAPTVIPTEPTVRDEVEKIRTSTHGAMPPAQRATTSAVEVSGRTTMSVQNSTTYELSVFFDGPVSKKLILAPGASQDVELAAGTFHVAGRVAAASVLPFYGEDSYAGSARYSLTFYIRH